MKLSFEQIRELVRQALEAAHNLKQGSWLYVVDLYEDAVVYEVEGPAGNKGPLYNKRTYTLADGKVTLGKPEPVSRKVEYIPLQAASRLLAADGQPGDDGYGFKWKVQVVEYGLGKDGRINWPREPLVAALNLYDGAKVFALNESQHQAGSKPFGKSVREIVGWLKNPVDTGTGIEADFFILKSAQWLRDNLVDSHERGNPTLFGLSHDVSARARTVLVGGKKVREPVEIVGVEVDVVYDPTNNGKFLNTMAAAVGREESMNLEKLLAALKQAKPKVYATVNTETVPEDEVLALLAAVETGGDQDLEQRLKAAVAAVTGELKAGNSADVEKLQTMLAAVTLDRELSASKLPEPAMKTLRARFAGKVFADEELVAAIKETKEMLDQLTASGSVSGAGDVRMGREGIEKLQAASDKLFGVKVDAKYADIQPMKSLRAAYVELTGDTDVRGYLDPGASQRLQAAYGSGTFSYVLGNTLYRRLVQDYKENSDYGVSRLVGPNIRKAVDFRTMESVQIGYYGDLPDVDPESLDFADLGEVSDEKVEYALNQKGGIISITRKMIINDDMRTVQKIISRLPRAARRTLAKRCWAKFIGNATYKGDNKAVFHADHGNLGATAYGIASALAAKTAMSLQTEADSGERLMLRPVTVAFPSELFGLVKNVNDFNPQAVAIADGNSMFGYFSPEGMIECPFMVDATDWMMFADPAEVEILELAFLNGQQEPEMFVADQPTNGQMFVADKIQYKIRHEYEAEIVDYRGVYKSVVAG